MKNIKVAILSGVNSKFGELWGVSPRDLVREIFTTALKDSGLEKSDLEVVFVGNMLAESLGNQAHLGAFFAEELDLHVPAIRVEGACASGGLAVHAGVLGITSGIYNTALILGVEKMTDYKPEKVAEALMGAGSDMERDAGASFPALYALMARAHMEKYKTTEEEMAAVAVKNHYHASLNSHAQYRNTITIEKVLQSSIVSSPLKLLDCSPISDGASVLILSSQEKARTFKRNQSFVNITASSVFTDTLGLAEREDLTSLKSASMAAKKAYALAGLKPQDIDVAEVHDCFTIAEIIAMEDLGFFPKGKAARAILKGETKLGGRPVVNTSGGLKAAGHPVGATGVKQVVEIYQQLSGQSGKKQVKNAKIGLTHNVGGSGATAVIHILRND